LRQIIEENARHDAENAEYKVKIKELEKNNVDISAENAELKAELAKLRHDFDFSNLTRPRPQHVTNMQNSCSVGEEEISAVPQPYASHDIPDPVIDQPINRSPGDNAIIILSH
jgi:predicted nuclease with TOPRIM domain